MTDSFDLVVVGGGSGGIACAIASAKLGAKCAVVEPNPLGGTCVNLGCVPKKIMWQAANTKTICEEQSAYGLDGSGSKLNWQQLVEHRQNYIAKLQNSYKNKLQENNIEHIKSFGIFLDEHTITTHDKNIKGKHIIIATGGHPFVPELPGHEHGITSDGFFALEKQPAKVAIIGAGYIAVELAGMLNTLGSDVSLAFRHKEFLRQFDNDISCELMLQYKEQGINLCPQHKPISITKNSDGTFCVNCAEDNKITNVDKVIWATGRVPNVARINLEGIGITTNNHNQIVTDNNYTTNIPHIHAIGDVTDKLQLTPIAIAQGRRLAAKLFNNQEVKPIKYELTPSVIFSHPPIATVGLSEHRAAELNINYKVYKAKFTPMSQALLAHPSKCMMKLIVDANDNERILGCHMIGEAVDEVLQGFAVAIQMGATKADFDNTIAIHPTLAEELVTMK